jgi:hypothetical protein
VYIVHVSIKKEKVCLIPRTSALTIRLPIETIEEIHHYAEILRLKPSTLCAMVINDKLSGWVKEYATKIYEDVKDLE